MNKEIFDYSLPKEMIAKRPLQNREEARLMVVNRLTKDILHLKFKDVVDFFKPGEILLLNNTKVIPARLYGKKTTGGAVEVLLTKKVGEGIWDVLIRGKVREGTQLAFEKISAVVVKKNTDGTWCVKFNATDEELFKIGKMPIPPYVKRKPEEEDVFYYQTVYAQKNGSIAAPTAGLHFTEKILQELERKGVIINFLTLHIGWASFRVIKNEKKVLPEFFEVSKETAAIINSALKSGRKICAVGTSTVRAIESAFEKDKVVARKGYTELFIEPGYTFRCVDKMITNFHLPDSTHLYMVCAFGGTDLIHKAYLTAIEKRYRFYSYGDAMLII